MLSAALPVVASGAYVRVRGPRVYTPPPVMARARARVPEEVESEREREGRIYKSIERRASLSRDKE